MSGPLADRIDMHVTVGAVALRELSGTSAIEDSQTIRRRVESARNLQRRRFARMKGVACNAFASGRWLDAVLSRAVDTLTSVPGKMFALIMVAAFGSSMPTLILTAAIIYLPGAYRIARSLAVNIDAMDYVTVARTRGEGRLYIMLHEILPNIVGPMLADLGLRFVYVVLLLASLSFLGLGVQPPAADWGSLVRENIGALPLGSAAIIMPALAIASLTIAVNLLIDNLPGRSARGAH
jgi:peptide/nickel transport system permease protein